MFISIGHSCHPAGNLQALGLRKESLPFDWLLISQPNSFRYINDLINTRFQNFTKDLIYNHRQKVVSSHYDYVEFFHHDLINNTTLNRPDDDNKNLVEIMNRRANRFMDIITNTENEIVFLCLLNHTKLFINDQINNTLYEDMLNFDNNTNIKCSYKVLVYLSSDEEGDYELNLPNEFLKLTHFIFEKHIINRTVNKIYGCKNDFEIMLNKYKFL
jgi:hypothetical protein